MMLLLRYLSQGYDIVGRVFKEDGKGKLGPIRVVLYDQNKIPYDHVLLHRCGKQLLR